MPLTILHLSDAHFGRPRDKFKSAEVLGPLLKDLELMRKRIGAPTLVIFSGDLAYGQLAESPLADQYKEVRSWIDQAYSALGTTLAEAPLMIIPGNHDVNRKVILPETTNHLTRDADAAGIERAMQGNTNQFPHWLERQHEWQMFARSVCGAGSVDLDEQLNCVRRQIEVDGQRVAVVGLNTSWSSHDDREKGRLWFGAYQMEKAHHQISQCDMRIVLTHHPTSWMNGQEPRIQQRIEQDFHIHFHGHEHSSWYTLTGGHLRIEAGACYADSPDDRSYSWLELDLQRQTGGLWVREFTDKAARVWIPAHHPPKTDEKGYADVGAFLRPQKNQVAAATRRGTGRRGDRSSTPKAPIVTQPADFALLKTPGELATLLQSEYGFVWESEDLKQAPPEKAVVYWPVRLREPTAIHAVQAFAAGGLMRKGARVVLCIDDLGTPDLPKEVLENALAKYVSKVGGNWNEVETRYFTALITDESFSQASQLMRRWLADLNYKLTDVLEVSKILEPNRSEIDNTKKPRRLFTPPLVWFCFLQMISEFGANITLGGHDERRLWEAWRRVTKKQHPVGHLYIPELREQGRATHMGDTKLRLRWDGLQDIEHALQEAIQDDQPLAEGRLLPWAFQGCLQLPSYLSGQRGGVSIDGKPIESVHDLGGVDLPAIVRPLARRIEHWMI